MQKYRLENGIWQEWRLLKKMPVIPAGFLAGIQYALTTGFRLKNCRNVKYFLCDLFYIALVSTIRIWQVLLAALFYVK